MCGAAWREYPYAVAAWQLGSVSVVRITAVAVSRPTHQSALLLRLPARKESAAVRRTSIDTVRKGCGCYLAPVILLIVVSDPSELTVLSNRFSIKNQSRLFSPTEY
jgi:hypothetical protein